ncbi:malate dehydrogenase [Pelomyxa schiedti]|nr:malate dehydrogenase [Pelomyxa schiedti]
MAATTVGCCGAELRRFAASCLVSAGASPSHAEVHADLLVTADERGVNSHGLNRLDMYVTELLSPDMTKGVEPVVMNETPGTAVVDGRGGLGGYVGTFCMNLAIQKARTNGIAMVVARGSNHYGIAGYYALLAEKQGMVGVSMTNSRKLVCPTRSTPPPALGTNPIAVSAPGEHGDSFTLDMATSTVPIGKVELCNRKGINVPIGWGVDGSGLPTTNPAAVLDRGGLAPLGGDEEHCGYKGYGLAMFVELFCGIMSGGKWGPNLGPWRKAENQGPADLSHCFIAIDPHAFNPNFEASLQGFMDTMRSLPATDPSKPVLVPGDPEMAKVKQQTTGTGMVIYPAAVANALLSLAEQQHITPPHFTPVLS